MVKKLAASADAEAGDDEPEITSEQESTVAASVASGLLPAPVSTHLTQSPSHDHHEPSAEPGHYAHQGDRASEL